MAIDEKREELISCYQGKKLPRSPSPNTLRNWINLGSESRISGERVFLESTQIGGRIYTSVEAYWRYIKRLNGHDDQELKCQRNSTNTSATRRFPTENP